MTENPDIVYGRLLESAHISGYSFERVCSELEWLLDEDRWKQVGPGYEDVNKFLRSIDTSYYNLGANRPQLVQRIKELQPKASNRAIADMVGVAESTVRNDLKPSAQNNAVAPSLPVPNSPANAQNNAPQTQGNNIVQVGLNQLRRAAKDTEREEKRKTNEALIHSATPLLECLQQAVFDTIVIDPPWD
jgi:hypothetical protein